MSVTCHRCQNQIARRPECAYPKSKCAKGAQNMRFNDQFKKLQSMDPPKLAILYALQSLVCLFWPSFGLVWHTPHLPLIQRIPDRSFQWRHIPVYKGDIGRYQVSNPEYTASQVGLSKNEVCSASPLKLIDSYLLLWWLMSSGMIAHITPTCALITVASELWATWTYRPSVLVSLWFYITV